MPSPLETQHQELMKFEETESAGKDHQLDTKQESHKKGKKKRTGEMKESIFLSKTRQSVGLRQTGNLRKGSFAGQNEEIYSIGN